MKKEEKIIGQTEIDSLKLYSQDLEMSLIGCLFLEPNNIEVLENFHPDHFYLPISKVIYDIINDHHIQGQSLTREGIIHVIIGRMDNPTEKEKQKLYSFLKQCLNASVTAINPIGVAKALIDLSIKRSLVNSCKKTIEDSTKSDYTAQAMKLVEEKEERLFQIAMYGRTEKSVANLTDLLAITIKNIEEKYKNRNSLHGVTTGLADLDVKLNGFQNSDLVIIAGRPAMGKTALAINMAINGAMSFVKKGEKKCALFFSLEMSADQLTNRIISMGTSINAFSLRSGHINQANYDHMVKWYAEHMHNMPFYIDDTPSMTTSMIRSRARKYARKHNLGIIFIDYLQLIETLNKGKNSNRVNELSQITRELKQLAKELNIPVIVLSQLSRYVEHREDKRPMLSDLRESGSIEQDADIVMFIYRDEYYKMRNQPRMGTPDHQQWQQEMEEAMNKAEIIISKHRNGPTGTVNAVFDNKTTTFKNYSALTE